MTSLRLRRLAFPSAYAAILLPALAHAATFYVSPTGSDSADGSLAHPFASLTKAQSAANSGDTVYLRAGTYTNFATPAATDATYNYGLNFSKSNITYAAYPGDARPVLDFSAMSPANLRVCAIEVTGSNNTFSGFDVTGVQAGTQKQADNWRIAGNGNTLNTIVTRDDQGNGVYLLGHASNTTVKNCDSYNLVGIANISAGNTDGFGCHSQGSGNLFSGDRSWGNSDDGYDCITNPGGGVTFDHCWAYDNGRFDGNANGFKIGGFGDTGGAFPSPPPVHTVTDCVSADNGANGFYANHQPGQAAVWSNNSAYNNKAADFNMLEATDTQPGPTSSVPGTREVLHNNLAYKGTLVSNLNESGEMVADNSFTLPLTVTAADFQSLDASQLTAARNPDGSLPDIAFLHLTPTSDLIDAGMDLGLPYAGPAPDLGAFESTPVPEPATLATLLLPAALLLRRKRST
ncbi:MAG TPA: pectate lyase [Phycisphaerae bacterium]|nr:pectate lyase [Phycisphaerae bacterium]